MAGLEDLHKQTVDLRTKASQGGASVVHRLNHIHCPLLFIIFALCCMPLGQNPIICLCPFTLNAFCKDSDGVMEYINSHCWVKNTYDVPFNRRLPDILNRGTGTITYYQWVAVIFLCQGILWLIPHMFWKIAMSQSGMNIKKIMDLADENAISSLDERIKNSENIAYFYVRWIKLEFKNNWKNANAIKRFVFELKANYLSVVFMSTDILYIVSALLQIYMLERFLDGGFVGIGTDFMQSQSFVEYEDHNRFPRITYCDFEIRQLSNLQTYTAQCHLSINMYVEKMFLCDWFVLVIAIAVNIANLLYDCQSLFFLKTRLTEKFSHRFLHQTDQLPKHTSSFLASFRNKTMADKKKKIEDFVSRYIHGDGCFVMWMLTGRYEIFADDLMRALWSFYCDKQSSVNHSDL